MRLLISILWSLKWATIDTSADWQQTTCWALICLVRDVFSSELSMHTEHSHSPVRTCNWHFAVTFSWFCFYIEHLATTEQNLASNDPPSNRYGSIVVADKWKKKPEIEDQSPSCDDIPNTNGQTCRQKHRPGICTVIKQGDSDRSLSLTIRQMRTACCEKVKLLSKLQRHLSPYPP